MTKFEQLKKLLARAYAPYSKFKVASIIVTDKGEFSGVNVENSAFGLTICAERNAVFNGVTNGIKQLYEVHVLTSAKDDSGEICGSCLQVIAQWANEKCKIYVYNLNGKIKKYTLKQLLPHAFKMK